MANVSYYLVPYDDLETAMQIESVGFHPDEAATLQSFQYRQKQAPELFLGAYSEENVPSTSPSNPLSPRELVGYVVSTIARDDTLKHEAMSHHVPASEGGIREQMPPGLLEALCGSTPRKRKTPQRISAFHSITELVSDDHSSGTQSNKYKLACPRQGCGSVILLPGVAKLVESASVGLDALALNPTPEQDPNFPLLPLPPPPETTEWWLITPHAMQFENIGFSRGVADPNDPSIQLKLLSCAECDLGPLGWCMQGGSEFWVACSRVSYFTE
ncbi:hypothetical protein FRC02_008407 [Tulasnella sp. 418]|nr:hypothetical protein FRC02_008407 [Tulasnella sp. 418]